MARRRTKSGNSASQMEFQLSKNIYHRPPYCKKHLLLHFPALTIGAAPLKIPITVRIDANLLDAVRNCALQENRNLTNFIETALRDRVGVNLACAPHSRPQTMAGSTKGQ